MKIKQLLPIVSQEIFHASVITYISLIFLEKVGVSFISVYGLSQWILGIVFVSGLLMIIWSGSEGSKFSSLLIFQEKMGKELPVLALFSLAGALLVYLELHAYGTFGLILSICSFFLHFLFATFLLLNP